MTSILLWVLPLLGSQHPPLPVKLECVMALANGPVMVRATITNTTDSQLVVYVKDLHQPVVNVPGFETHNNVTVNSGSFYTRFRETVLTRGSTHSVIIPVHRNYVINRAGNVDVTIKWRLRNDLRPRQPYVAWCVGKISVPVAAEGSEESMRQVTELRHWCRHNATLEERALALMAIEDCRNSDCASVAREFLDRLPSVKDHRLYRAGFGRGTSADLDGLINFLGSPGQHRLLWWCEELRSLTDDQAVRPSREQVLALTEAAPVPLRLLLYITFPELFAPESISRLHWESSRYWRTVPIEEIMPAVDMLRSPQYRTRADGEARLHRLGGSATRAIKQSLRQQSLDAEQIAILNRVVEANSRPISPTSIERHIAWGLVYSPHCHDLLTMVLKNDPNSAVVRAIELVKEEAKNRK